MSSDSKLLLNSHKYNVNDIVRQLNNCPLLIKVGELEGSNSIDFYELEVTSENNLKLIVYLCSSATSPLGKCLSVFMDKSPEAIALLKFLAKVMGGFFIEDTSGYPLYEASPDPLNGLEFYLVQAQTKGTFKDTNDPDVHCKIFSQDLKKNF